MFEWPIYKLRQGQVWFDVGFRRIPANQGLTQDQFHRQDHGSAREPYGAGDDRSRPPNAGIRHGLPTVKARYDSLGIQDA